MKEERKSSTKKNEKYFLVYQGINQQKHALKWRLEPYNERLEYLQGLVGGYLEHYPISRQLEDLGIDMWIDEEGKLKRGLEPTWALCDPEGHLVDIIVGTCVFSKFNKEGETLGLDQDEVEFLDEWLRSCKKVQLISEDRSVNSKIVLMSKGD